MMMMMIFWLEDEDDEDDDGDDDDDDDDDDAKMHWAPRSFVVAWWCTHFDLLLSQLAKILWQLFMIAIICYYLISVCKSMSRIWGYPAIIETKFKTGLYFFIIDYKRQLWQHQKLLSVDSNLASALLSYPVLGLEGISHPDGPVPAQDGCSPG